MISRTGFLVAILAAGLILSGAHASAASSDNGGRIRIYSTETGTYAELPVVKRSDMEWKKILSPSQFHILREEGTERPFTGSLWNNHRKGVYRCAGCGTDLFSSETKYESGTGWPSFWQPVAPGNIRKVKDNSFFMRRVEVECARCGGHLGHVFEDGPPPTGLRYCINSASLTFVETGDMDHPVERGK